jgi:hypothetical protein
MAPFLHPRLIARAWPDPQGPENKGGRVHQPMMEHRLMLTALILVCSLATVSNDCTRDNALDVVYVPATFASPVTCMMQAQAYLADSSIGRDLPQNEAIKVICVRGPINRVDKTESGPKAWAH